MRMSTTATIKALLCSFVGVAALTSVACSGGTAGVGGADGAGAGDGNGGAGSADPGALDGGRDAGPGASGGDGGLAGEGGSGGGGGGGGHDDGGAGGASGTAVFGQVDGQSLTAASSIMTNAFSASGALRNWSLLIDDGPRTCERVQSGYARANGNGLGLRVFLSNPDAPSSAVQPGVYPLGFTVSSPVGTFQVTADYWRSDVNCDNTVPVEDQTGASGTITIDTLTATHTSGRFDVHFASGGRLSGTFDTDACDISGAPATTICRPWP